MRKQREAVAVIAQTAAEARALKERRARARAEQLKKAFQMAETKARVQQLTEFLACLEATADSRLAPLSERVKVWLDVVKKELDARNQVESMLQQCLSVPSWGNWPPIGGPPSRRQMCLTLLTTRRSSVTRGASKPGANRRMGCTM